MKINFRIVIGHFISISSLLFITIFSGCETDNTFHTEIIGPENPVIDAPVSISLFDIGNENNASDIRVFFNAGASKRDIEEYRILIVRSELADALTLDEALSYNAERYKVHLGDRTVNKLNLDGNIVDIEGNAIVNEIDYNIFILAIPNSSDIKAKLSAKSDDFQLTNTELKDIYVTSDVTNSVELYDGITGEFIKSFVPSNYGFLWSPQDMVYQESNDLFLGIARASRDIKIYHAISGEYLGRLNTNKAGVPYLMNFPSNMNIGPDGNLYVSQIDGNFSFVQINIKTGEVISELLGQPNHVTDHAWDSFGNTYLALLNPPELRKYSDDFSIFWGSTNTNLTEPINLWMSPLDVLHVFNKTEGTVNRYDRNLNYIDTFIETNAEINGFAVNDNKLYICDTKNGKVNIYDSSTGEFIDTLIDSQKIKNATSLTFGPDLRPENSY